MRAAMNWGILAYKYENETVFTYSRNDPKPEFLDDAAMFYKWTRIENTIVNQDKWDEEFLFLIEGFDEANLEGVEVSTSNKVDKENPDLEKIAEASIRQFAPLKNQSAKITVDSISENEALTKLECSSASSGSTMNLKLKKFKSAWYVEKILGGSEWD